MASLRVEGVWRLGKVRVGAGSVRVVLIDDKPMPGLIVGARVSGFIVYPLSGDAVRALRNAVEYGDVDKVYHRRYRRMRDVGLATFYMGRVERARFGGRWVYAIRLRPRDVAELYPLILKAPRTHRTVAVKVQWLTPPKVRQAAPQLGGGLRAQTRLARGLGAGAGAAALPKTRNPAPTRRTEEPPRDFFAVSRLLGLWSQKPH